MGKSLNKLKNGVKGITPLSSQAWEAFACIWHPLTVSKKQLVASTGTIDPYFYFNLKGILRWVHQSEDGNETTIEFIQEGAFSAYLDIERRQKPSQFALQALTKTKLLRCLYTDLDTLINQYPDIELFIRISLGRRMEALLQHLVVVQCCNSQEKYDKALKEAPKLLQLVPQKYIANHLGIHATNFSKYKKPKHSNRN